MWAAPPPSDTVPPGRFVDPFAADTAPGPTRAPRLADPLEGYNRGAFAANHWLFLHALRPLSRGYHRTVSPGVRGSLRNVFANLGEPVTVVNALLQGRWWDARTSAGRFVVNSVWGLGGLFDPASRDLPPVRHSFGETLSRWGVGPGPYVVYPLYGSYTLRDSVDLLAHWAVNPAVYSGDARLAGGVEMLNLVSEASERLPAYEIFARYALDPYEARKRLYERQLWRRKRR